MKAVVTLLFLTFVGLAAWELSSSLSSDAVGMAVGVIFGIIAGIPTALLVLAGGRRRPRERYDSSHGSSHGRSGYGGQGGHGGQGYPMHYQHPPFAGGNPNPPVIVITAPGAASSNGMPNGMANGQAMGYPGTYDAPTPGRASSDRRFKIVGETEEWIDEW